MRHLKKLLIINLILLLNSCGTIKEGFTNQKKNSSDEFLVEKKSPLVMPPDFNELPIPNQDSSISKNNSNKIEKLIKNSDNEKDKTLKSNNVESNIEENFIKKIKKN